METWTPWQMKPGKDRMQLNDKIYFLKILKITILGIRPGVALVFTCCQI
jgi:hypothetical protein